jgi:hypothetical protein
MTHDTDHISRAAVHPAFDCRQWWNYVVPMPLTADDQGPATVGVDAAKMHYEVWDRDHVTRGSFDYLSDAINYAMALNYDLPAVQPAPDVAQIRAERDAAIARAERAEREVELIKQAWYGDVMSASAMKGGE